MKRIGGFIGIWLAVALSACGGGGGDRTVTVSAVQTFWSTTGIESQETSPLDAVTLVQSDGAGGTRRVVATLQRDASWTATLPPGPYWAEVRRNGRTVPDLHEVATGGDVVDLGIEWMAISRPFPAVETPVAFQVQGLVPWEAGDRLSVYGWDAGVDHEADPSLGLGVTQGTWTVPWRGAFGQRVVPSDLLRVSQVRTSAASDGGTVMRLVASASVSGLTMVDGVQLDAAVPALAAPTRTIDLRLDLRAGAFADALQPGAADQAARVLVRAQPVPDYVFGNVLPLLRVAPVAAIDHDFGTLSFGVPVPDSWSLKGFVDVSGFVTRAIPGTGDTFTLTTSITRTLDLGSGAPIAPLVTPVRALRVGGADASAPLTGVGSAPRLQWTAPATGAQPRYTVVVHELLPSGGPGRLLQTFFAAVKGASVDLPAGTLEAGKTYVITVTATVGGGEVGKSRWWRDGFGDASASLVSETIQP